MSRPLDDMEEELERDNISEDSRRLLCELDDMFISDDQIKDKGALLGSFSSSKKKLYVLEVIALLIVAVLCGAATVTRLMTIPAVIVTIVLCIVIGVYQKQFHMYLVVYENALAIKAQSRNQHKIVEEELGIALCKDVVIEGGIMYIVLTIRNVYELKHLKNMERAAYLINKQIGQYKVR